MTGYTAFTPETPLQVGQIVLIENGWTQYEKPILSITDTQIFAEDVPPFDRKTGFSSPALSMDAEAIIGVGETP